MRLVVLSDTHGAHEKGLSVPDGDVLLHLGDICDRGCVDHIRSFRTWLQQQPHATKVVVEGNHDRDLNSPGRINLARELNGVALVLNDQTLALPCPKQGGEVRVHGSAWDTCETEEFAATLPADAPPDVLLTHLPPFVDTTGLGARGSKALAKLVERRRIPLHLFGHVHLERGAVEHPPTVFVNCSTLQKQAVVIDWDVRERRAVLVWCPTQAPSTFRKLHCTLARHFSRS